MFFLNDRMILKIYFKSQIINVIRVLGVYTSGCIRIEWSRELAAPPLYYLSFSNGIYSSAADSQQIE